ncbi:hypothetical protein GKZ68_05600 [Hymenobacter sp. BRD128]|uniref:hypothetical protein n=1 Tax=Hymenobacter sp. BRD128 TaxID=2675878 RepID=UPI0015654FE9|nr:hypothetical protein [Hymenobacter sp. BRD128]QKG56164.1 hypothetical protein GKZ68_05600 [Hymenobacter sp. BRD128]
MIYQLKSGLPSVDHQSGQQLASPAIPQLHHHFGDSAKVTLTGTALGSVLKQCRPKQPAAC